jgi:hypothetical protein
MAVRRLADRVADLEAEVARLKVKIENSGKSTTDWLDTVCGSFANDPMHEEAMRLGREWRESFRPKPRKPRKRK